MATLINGTDIIVKFGAEDSEVAIYCSTSCTLNLNTETIGATCKDGGSWVNNLEGTKSWDVSVDGLYQVDTANGFTDMADLMITGPNAVSLLIGQQAATGEIFWKGAAVLTSVSLTAPDGEIATWSASFTGSGALTEEVVPV